MRDPGTPSFGPFLLAAALLSTGCTAPLLRRAGYPSQTPPPAKKSDSGTAPSVPGASGSTRAAPGAVPATLAEAEAHFAAGRLDEAVEAAKDAAERSPTDARPWLLRAKAERLLAAAAAEAADGTTAQLRLVDARASSERAVALAPKDPEAWRERGRVLRDSSKFLEAGSALQKALDLAGSPDGETQYDLAYCLAFAGDFRGALAAFDESEKLLGPQTRIAVNAAICEEKLGNRAAATTRLAARYDAECAAGRAAGPDAQRLLEKTWELTVQRLDYAAGKAALRTIASTHPDRPEPSYMLGNLLAFLGEHSEAAVAYETSFAAEPRPATRLRMARALAAAGRPSDAEAPIHQALEKDPGIEGTLETTLFVGRALFAGRRPTGAREVAEAALRCFPDESALLLLAGDASMAEGDGKTALETYRRAAESASLSTEPAARAARAELAVVRNGDDAGIASARFAADGKGLDPVPAGETLVDFEDARLFVRPLGGTRIVEGSIRFPPPAEGGTRRVALHFFPDLDATRWSHLDLRLRSEGGAAGLHVEMADGMDQMSDLPAGRLRWPVPGNRVPLGPDWSAVSVPLREFEMTDPVRNIPAALARVKCLVLDVKPDDGKTPVHLGIDSASLRDAKSGRTLLLQDFDEGISEVAVTYEGTTPPFTRHVANVEMIQDLLPTGTTPISKGILEGQNGTFDAAMVGRGAGALRIRHGDSGWFPSKKGTAAGTSSYSGNGSGGARVTLNPDRDLQRFRAITFLARGESGGENLRVGLSDAHDLAVGKEIVPARWPRSTWPRTAKDDGKATLTKEWRMYRIPLASFPEIDPAAFAELYFEIGDDAGNSPGATVYLDEIGLEY
jgi:tetratricopeptide (TPR) repeat protein